MDTLFTWVSTHMQIFAWIAFHIFVIAMLFLDMKVFHRKAHTVKVREALFWTAVWIVMALLFNVGVYFFEGRVKALEFLAGYLVEKSLSVDNIFVFLLIFTYFRVPGKFQHTILFWGILGALIMRGAMIGIGAALIARFHWILYVFGAFLILTAVKMLVMKTDHVDPNANVIVRWTRRLFPVTEQFHGEHFLVKAGSKASHEAAVPGAPVLQDKAVDAMKVGTWMITPLMLALIMIEFTDLIFAVDSIPAIFAITADPFLVFTSNVFAILGLRSLYFALAGMITKFRYLKVSLAVVLAVVGGKMLAASWLKATIGPNFNFYLLGLILFILTGGVVASLIADKRNPIPEPVHTP